MDISLERLLSLLLSKIKYVILITFVFTIGTFLIMNNMIEKKYTSESAMMIQINTQSNQNTNNELSVTKQSVANYIRTLYTYNFYRVATDEINSQLGTNYSARQILKNSTIKPSSADKSSSDFNITYTAATPELAQKILYIITDEAIEYLIANNASNPVNRIEDPSLPGGPSYPKTRTYTLYAFLVSFVMSTAIFFFIEIFDDRIKNVKDLTSEYSVSILGVIPDYVTNKKTKNKKVSYANSYSKEETKNG